MSIARAQGERGAIAKECTECAASGQIPGSKSPSPTVSRWVLHPMSNLCLRMWSHLGMLRKKLQGVWPRHPCVGDAA